MQKLSLPKNNRGTPLYLGGDQRVHTFPQGINPKVNVIVRLEFKLTHFETAVRHIKLYATETPPTTNLIGLHNLQFRYYSNTYVYKELAKLFTCSPIAREIGAKSQAESYQRLKNGTWCLLA